MKKLLIICVVVVLALVFGSIAKAVVVFSFEPVGAPVYTPGAEFPYEYQYELTITHLDPEDSPITDAHIEWPVYYGGYIEVVPPENWVISEFGLYGIDYEANTSDEWMTTPGTLGGFVIYGQLPDLVGGSVSVTKYGSVVSTIQADLPAVPEPVTIFLLGFGGLMLIRKK